MEAPFARTDLVLVGGGHAHVQVLKSLGMRPAPGVRLTLVSRDVETPYSGMLPGLIAGHYEHDHCHIDLVRLARFAGARLIHAEASGIDRGKRQVLFAARPPLRYDFLSLDIGSTPTIDKITGAAEHAVRLKPIDGFDARWRGILDEVCAAHRQLDIVVVGGGAGGVEITLAMQHRLRTLLQEGGHGDHLPRFTIVTRHGLLPRFAAAARRAFRRTLDERGIEVRTDSPVSAVEDGTIRCADGSTVAFDRLVWATEAGAAPWLRETGLALDEKGFVAVDASLRSVGDDRIFAAGDIAAVLPHPREKAGVFAVRQGPPLARNLRRAVAGLPPLPFTPQRHFLSIVSTGDRHAVASRGRLAVAGDWVWRVKDWIDRRWMRQFQELPAAMPALARTDAREAGGAMRCAGCGGKLASPVLQQAMARLGAARGAAVELGLDALEDAAMLRPREGRLLLQTVDFFRSFIGDPWLFGRIAANHALGDVYAMGGRPVAALAIATLPPAAEELLADDLFQMLRGGLDTLEAAGATLVGGHSAEGSELALGFSVTGDAVPGRLLRKGGLRACDRLLLTKPLGTGCLLAAEMQGRAKGRWIAAALEAMLLSNAAAAAILAAHGARAATDVTGFGLAGHLLEMLRASGVGAHVAPAAVPALDGALETLAAGIASTLAPANEAAALAALSGASAPGHARRRLLFDPQTAGGLLAGVAEESAAACLAALRANGYREAAIIGVVTAGEPAIRLTEASAVGAPELI